ncbi:hypothetical protein LINPERPRIM_LOCUS24539, partial [Linum perenne]
VNIGQLASLLTLLHQIPQKNSSISNHHFYSLFSTANHATQPPVNGADVPRVVLIKELGSTPNMEINRARLLLLLLLAIVLLILDSSWADSKVDVNGKTVRDPNSKPNNSSNENAGDSNFGSRAVTDDKEKQKGSVNEVKKEDKGGVADDGQKKDLNVKVGDKETGKGNADLEKHIENGSLNGGEEAKKEVDVKNEEGKKEISNGEECDPSNKCLIEDSKLVACIRVPGNDAPDLSLLIQNNGEVPVSVTILSSDFVHLEKNSIQLQQKEKRKVKVSINGKGRGSSIVLKTGTSSSCSLDIRDLIDHNSGDNIKDSRGSTYTISNLPLLLACFAGISMVVASARGLWITISKRRKLSNTSSSNYQRLDMDLPVSGAGKKTTQSDDGWDNSWGDGWDDDEEMPMTPNSMAVTPSLSSKGLASRSRLGKDGWKD